MGHSRLVRHALAGLRFSHVGRGSEEVVCGFRLPEHRGWTLFPRDLRTRDQFLIASETGDVRPTIALFVPTLGIGGGERQTIALARGLDKRRWRVLLIQAGSEPTEYTVDLDGMPRIMLGGGSFVQVVRKLMRCLTLNRVMILQAFLLPAQAAALAARALCWRGRLVVSVRDALPVFRSDSLPAMFAGNVVFGCSWWVDHYLFNSERAIRTKRWMIPERKRTAIHNGIDTERFRPDPDCHVRLRALIRASGTSRIVGMVANLSDYKDYPNFVEAARLVVRRHTDVHFVAIGDDRLPGNDAIRSQVDQAGLRGRVHLLGVRTDVEHLVPGFELYCLSSKTESFPNALAEAMACEVPPVATDAGDAAEIVGETGLVVPSQSPRRLAQGLLEALAWSPAERVVRGEAARARIVSHFSFARMLQRHEELYLRLLRNHRPD